MNAVGTPAATDDIKPEPMQFGKVKVSFFHASTDDTTWEQRIQGKVRFQEWEEPRECHQGRAEGWQIWQAAARVAENPFCQ